MSSSKNQNSPLLSHDGGGGGASSEEPGVGGGVIGKVSAKERILDAAAELFYAGGINSTGVDAIVARSGVAKMTLYKHFESKDLLVAAWLRRSSQLWRGNLEGSLDAISQNPREKLDHVFDVLGKWFGRADFRGCAFINCLAELSDPAHPARVVAAEHRKLVRAYLSRLAWEAGFKEYVMLGEVLGMLADGATVAALAERSPDAAKNAAAVAATILRSAR